MPGKIEHFSITLFRECYSFFTKLSCSWTGFISAKHYLPVLPQRVVHMSLSLWFFLRIDLRQGQMRKRTGRNFHELSSFWSTFRLSPNPNPRPGSFTCTQWCSQTKWQLQIEAVALQKARGFAPCNKQRRRHRQVWQGYPKGSNYSNRK